MKIETKFDIGQEVWFIHNLNILEGIVHNITISSDPAELDLYNIGFDGISIFNERASMSVNKIEPLIFATKSEAEQAVKRLEGKDEKI